MSKDGGISVSQTLLIFMLNGLIWVIDCVQICFIHERVSFDACVFVEAGVKESNTIEQL